MADRTDIYVPEIKTGVTVNVSGVEQLQLLSKTLNTITNNKKLVKYWKEQDGLVDSVVDACNRFNDTLSEMDASELMKTVNALKAFGELHEVDLSHIIPDFDEVMSSFSNALNKIPAEVKAAFSPDVFKDLFKFADTAKANGASINEFFESVSDNKIDELSKSLETANNSLERTREELENTRREYNEFLNGSGLDELTEKLETLELKQKSATREAKEYFKSFLISNNLKEFLDRWDIQEDYIEEIEKGNMTALQAVSKFKDEYEYMFKDMDISTNILPDDFVEKLENIFTTVQNIAKDIQDIIENGIITKSVQNIFDDDEIEESQKKIFENLLKDENVLKSISSLIEGIISNTGSIASNGTLSFDESQFNDLSDTIKTISDSLLTMKGAFEAVGEDGETFSPLLKSLNDIIEATKRVTTAVGELNFNVNITPQNLENDELVEKAKGSLLSVYKDVATKMSYSNLDDNIVGFFRKDAENYIDFNQFDNIDIVLGQYEKILSLINKKLEEEGKRINKIKETRFNKEIEMGIRKKDETFTPVKADRWQNYAKEQARILAGARATLTNQGKKLKTEVSDNNDNLPSLFGDNSKELEQMIDQLRQIIEQLNNMNSSLSHLGDTFKDVFGKMSLSLPINEVVEMTEKIRTLEAQISFLNANAQIKPVLQQEQITGARSGETRFFESDNIIKYIKSEIGNIDNNTSEEIREVFKNAGNKSIDEIKNEIINILKNSSSFIESIFNVDENQLNSQQNQVLRHIRKHKIKYDPEYRKEFGDDYNRMNAMVGFTSKDGSDLISILDECNTLYGTTFNVDENKNAFKELYDFLTAKSTLSVDKLPDDVKETIEMIIEMFTGFRRSYMDSKQSGSGNQNASTRNTHRWENLGNRNIISQNGLRETYIDENGNEVGSFEFVERLKDGQLRHVLAEYDGMTQQWTESTISLDTAFEKVGNEILALDEKIARYEIDRDKIKASHPDYDTSADDDLIALATKRRTELENTLKVYNEEEEYAYEMQKFEEKRIENNERIKQLKDKQTNLTNVKKEEKEAKSEKQKEIAIERTNKTLDNQLQKIKNIQASYDKSISPGLKKAVTNQNDLNLLNDTHYKNIETAITGLRDKDASITELQNIENLISEYRRLVKIKIEANNVSDKELASKNLDVAVSELIAKYKKLIEESKNYGESSKKITEQLENQLKILEAVDATTGKSTVSAKDFYTAQATYKVDKAEISTIKDDKERKRVYDELINTINEYVEVKKRISDGNEFVDDITNAEKLKEKIDELRKNPILSKEQLDKSKKILDELYESLNNKEKVREQSKVFNELIDSINRYYTVSKRIVRNEALSTDNDEAAELQERIEILQNSPILSSEQIEKAGKKLEDIEQSLIDIQEQTHLNNLSSMEQEIDNFQSIFDKISVIPQDINQSDKYKIAIQNVSDGIVKLKEAYNELKKASTEDDIKEKTELYNMAKESLKNYINEVKTMPNAEKGSREIGRSKEIEKINELLKKNTKYSKEAQNQLHYFMQQLENGDASINLEKIHNEVLKIARAEHEAGREGKSFIDILNNKAVYGLATRFASYYLSMMDLVRYAKTGFETIRKLDTALVDLRKTTSMNTDELKSFYYSANDVAKSMGVTTEEIINQASAFSRLGYNTKEQSETMARLSSQFASISPDMDVSQATDGLVSVMKAFDIQTDEVQRKILDNINRIGNTAATSNGEIVDMLMRSSSAMKEANNSLEETIALETAAIEITRNAETTGTAFKTISMRIRGKSLPPYTVMYVPCA